MPRWSSVLIALALCLLTSVASAQTSPDPTEGVTVTDAQGRHWSLDPNGIVLRDGAVLSGVGSVYLWTGGVLYIKGTDDAWYRWDETIGWWRQGLTKPALATPPPVVNPPPPSPPVVVSSSATFCAGESPKVSAAHDGKADSYRLYQDGAVVQTQPVSALSGGVITFALPPLVAGSPTFLVGAVNAAGEAKSQPVAITVLAKFDFAVKGWPGGQSGSRSFSYATNYPIASMVLSWPLKVLATATNGCTVTVTK